MKGKEPVKLTRTERWILSNQYRILESIRPQDGDHYRDARTALENGYELHYHEIAEHIYRDALTLSEEECTEVIDILSLFTALQDSYNALSDKSGIDTWKIKFRGFDGNNETKQMAYARYYCTSGGGRFAGLEHPEDFNSHAHSLDRYQQMLRRWKQGGEENPLSKEQIVEIIRD
jgi:uncharacterized protein YfbU (UPF0304 family)